MTVRRVPASSSAARAALLFTLAIPFLAGAGENPSREKNRNRIESMNAADRARLERNFAHFKDLSESEREKYRILDRQIREDNAAGGRLHAFMNEYVAWLATLSPYERETIQKETNLTARAQLVARIQMEHEQPRARPDDRPRIGGRPREGGGGWNWLLNRRRLSPEDLDGVVAVVTGQIKIPNDELAELEKLKTPQQHLRILSRAMGPPDGRPRRNRWPDEALLSKMIAAIIDEPQREILNRVADIQTRRQLLGGLVAGALAAEWRTELEKLKPDEDALHKQFVELDPARRAELELLSPDELRQTLAFGVLSRENPELREFISVWQRLTHRPLRGREQRGGPDGRPDQDDRRGPRPGGRRGPPDRGADGPGPDGPRPDGPPPDGPDGRRPGPEGRPPRDPEGRRFDGRPPMPPGGGPDVK